MKIQVIASTKSNYIAPQQEFDTISGHAAGICYMPHTFEELRNENIEKTLKRVNNTKTSGHHSVYDHCKVTLVLENIPKALAMVLNNEHDYTTSEKSARYTKMILPENEKKLYDKWLEIYKELIKGKYQAEYPSIFTDKKIEKLAQENARYLISVFTPTTMQYTTSYRQLNYLCEMMQKEIKNPSNAFYLALKPAMESFCESITNFKYSDPQLQLGAAIKNRKLSLIGSMIHENIYSDMYQTKYKASLAYLAQAQRHRTLTYTMNLLDEPEFYVPPILENSDQLKFEWHRDCESLTSNFPQGLLVNISELGTMDWFIQKMKERKCTFAQLEINQQTDKILNQYVEALKIQGHPRAEELAQYTKGSRCTFPDYKCLQPCGFKEGITGERII